MLSKLEFYGIAVGDNNLIKSYLNKRYKLVLLKNRYSKNYYSEWEEVKQGVPQGLILGPLLFLLYINDQPGVINERSKPTLFADDTNTISIQPDLMIFREEIDFVFDKISKWFQTNLLLLHLKKTNFMQFSLKSSQRTFWATEPMLSLILTALDSWVLLLTAHCLGIYILHKYVRKLNSACYLIRSLRPIISTHNLRTIYFSYVHSIITYRIIFWGNSSNRNTIFKLQKRAIRIIMNTRNVVSCHELFKKFNILPLHSQYIVSLTLFVVKNIEEFSSNSWDSHHQHP